MYVQWMTRIKYDLPFLLHINFKKQYIWIGLFKRWKCNLKFKCTGGLFLIRNDLRMMKDWRNKVVLIRSKSLKIHENDWVKKIVSIVILKQTSFCVLRLQQSRDHSSLIVFQLLHTTVSPWYSATWRVYERWGLPDAFL